MYTDWVRPRPATPDQLAQLLDHATTATGQLGQLTAGTTPRDAIAGDDLAPILNQLEQLTDTLDHGLLQLAGCLVASLAVDDHRADAWDTAPSTTVAQACDQLDDAATHQYRAGRCIAAARAVVTGQPTGTPPQPAKHRPAPKVDEPPAVPIEEVGSLFGPTVDTGQQTGGAADSEARR